MSKTIGVEGWTIVHQARQKHYDDRFYGQFLGTHEDGRWIVGRMWSGKSMDDGFHDGGWDWSRRFAGNPSTGNADAALKAYIEMSHVTFVWDRVFERRVGEAIDRYWAGPEVPGAPKLSAGWCRTPAGLPAGSTIRLPFHEAKYRLLQYLRGTKSAARPGLNTRAFILHDTVEAIRQATGPFRIQYGHNAYWLDTDA
ncbi:hypothetical protein AB0A98_06080 [Streptomyces chrestomyceticus]|uniref:hypothetical protein n=1 Tax=Streptomyces chrestomyceticus TaxID=68185 RepID=UPI0033FBCF0A